MKKLTGILCATLLVLGFSACNDDDDNPVIQPNVSQVTTGNITAGSWHVTLFQEDDEIHTNYFTGYNFVFGADNNLTASNGVNTYTGAWSISQDDSSSDDFNILFANPSNFAELTEDWDITETTPTKLRLKHTSGGDGSIDYVTFEKNP